MRALVASLGLVLAACGSDPAIPAERTGVRVSGTQVTVGAYLHAPEPSGEAAVRVTLLDEEGGEIGVTEDSLPFCTGRCPWGGTFVGEQFGPDWGRATTARVEARFTPVEEDAATAPVEVERAPDGTLTGVGPGLGSVMLVVERAGAVVAGASVNVWRDRPFTMPPELLRTEPGERIVAVFYPHDPDEH